jgi:hypothetical protein
VRERDLAAALTESLRPLIAELVAQEVERRMDERDQRSGDRVAYLTTTEYAARFRTTPEAVGARIRRGTLPAIKPPGGREWLIRTAENEGYDGQQ